MTAILILALGQDPGLLGDESRRWLRERGLFATLAWTGEVVANVDGGLDEDVTTAMLLDLIVEGDLEKLLGWTGARALFNPIWVEGGGVTERDLRDLSVVSNIDAPDGIRLFEMWVEQAAFDDLVSLRVGVLSLDTDLALVPGASLFVNGSFGGPAFMTVNVPTPAYPFGSAGARVRVRPTAGTYAAAAVYEGDPGDEEENRYGVRIRHPGGEGLLGVLETGWKAEGLAASGGAFFHTGEFMDYASGTRERGVYGVYALVDAALLAEPALGGFARAGFVREGRAVAVWTFDAGLTWTGIVPGRGEDALGLGVVWIEVSDDFRRAQPDPDAYDREIVFEATYRIAAAPGVVVQPDVQFVRHPGGTSAVDDALVLLLRVDLLFCRRVTPTSAVSGTRA